ncbi:6073_t:CDS:2 [Dentiscutata heterogama]|uniref:6073_t:CDS:1 n=1 Tax=Dentiscutata heterogama TaxID=1316150 RepID=A0ACA9JX27_9GLOM|nr:6073_t:CDS:2 [Dentiscutata heterogama]
MGLEDNTLFLSSCILECSSRQSLVMFLDWQVVNMVLLMASNDCPLSRLWELQILHSIVEGGVSNYQTYIPYYPQLSLLHTSFQLRLFICGVQC